MSRNPDPTELAALRCLHIVEALRRIRWHLCERLRPGRCRPFVPLDADEFLRNVPANIDYLAVPHLALIMIILGFALGVAGEGKGGDLEKMVIIIAGVTIIQITQIISLKPAFKVIGNSTFIIIMVSMLVAVFAIVRTAEADKFDVAMTLVLFAGAGLGNFLLCWLYGLHRARRRAWHLENKIRYYIQLSTMLLSIPLLQAAAWIHRRQQQGEAPGHPECFTPGCAMMRRELAVKCRICETHNTETMARVMAEDRAERGPQAGNGPRPADTAARDGFVRIDAALERPFVSRCPACGHLHPIWDTRAALASVWPRITRCDTPGGCCVQDEGHRAIQIMRVGGADAGPVIRQIAQWADSDGPCPPDRAAGLHRLPLRLAGDPAINSRTLTLIIHDRPQTKLHGAIPLLIVLPRLGGTKGHDIPSLRAAVDNLAFAGRQAPVWFWWPDERGALPGDDSFHILRDAQGLNHMLDCTTLASLNAGWAAALAPATPLHPAGAV